MQLSVKFFDVSSSGNAATTNSLAPTAVLCEPSSDTILDIKKRIAALETAPSLARNSESVQLSFNGRIFADSDSLSGIGVKDFEEATLYAIVGSGYKHENLASATKKQKRDVSETDVTRVFNGLRRCLSERTKRRRLHGTLLNKESTKSLLAAVPDLADDIEALALLKYPMLLYRMAASFDECQRMMTKHPVLGEALQIVLTQVTSATSDDAVSSMFADPVVALISGLGMDDDEDGSGPSRMEGVAPAAGNRRGGQPPAARPPSFFPPQQQQQQPSQRGAAAQAQAAQAAQAAASISPQMLSNALSAVLLGLTQQQPQQQQNAQPRVVPPPAAASSSAPSLAAAAAPPPQALTPQQRFQVQLATLRSMGVSNDAVALAALEATNGDIEAALEFIFNSME